MRLIKADEFGKKLKDHADKLYAGIAKGATYPNLECFDGLSFAQSVADCMPTVEAIPVEWIQKYADNVDSFAKSNPAQYRGYAEGADWIRNMVKNWREEHETD